MLFWYAFSSDRWPKGVSSEDICKTRAARALGISCLVQPSDDVSLEEAALSPRARVLSAYALHMLPIHESLLHSAYSKNILSWVDPQYHNREPRGQENGDSQVNIVVNRAR